MGQFRTVVGTQFLYFPHIDSAFHVYILAGLGYGRQTASFDEQCWEAQFLNAELGAGIQLWSSDALYVWTELSTEFAAGASVEPQLDGFPALFSIGLELGIGYSLEEL